MPRDYKLYLRDILTHHYFELRMPLIWEVLVGELTPLRAQIARLLEEG